MNLSNLYLFKRVVEVGNMTEAGKQLHMTQPAISMQIKRLEQKVGVPLITAYPKGIKPTDAGAVLLHYCEKLKEVEDEMWRAMEEFRDLHIGHVIIGAPIELRTYLLPKIKAHFMHLYPGIKLEERTVADTEIEAYVKKGIIDIGLTLHGDVDHFHSRVTLLKQEPLLLFTESITARRKNLYLSNRSFLDTGIEFMNDYKNVIEVDSPELMKQAVLAGLGDGIGLKCTLQSELTTTLLKEKEMVRVESVSIVTRPAEKIQMSVKTFIQEAHSMYSL